MYEWGRGGRERKWPLVQMGLVLKASKVDRVIECLSNPEKSFSAEQLSKLGARCSQDN